MEGTENLERAIAFRYAPPEWAVVYELADGVAQKRTGRGGRIDAAAFGCWPSKGLLRVAFEVKRTRQDFKREVTDPAKSAWVEANFHQTYFVAPGGLIRLDEVPESWGLLESDGSGRLIERKVAMRRNPGPLPEALALSAIRALGERLHREMTREWWFDGEHLDAADMERRVDELTAHRRKMLDDQLQAARKEHQLLADEKSRLRAPLVRMSQVVRETSMMRRTGGYRPGDEPLAATVDDVNRWADLMRGQAAHLVRDQIQGARRRLDEAVAALDELQARVVDAEKARRHSEEEADK